MPRESAESAESGESDDIFLRPSFTRGLLQVLRAHLVSLVLRGLTICSQLLSGKA